MRREIVEAVQRYDAGEAGCPHWTAARDKGTPHEGAHDDVRRCAWCCEAIARTVLRAALTGKPEGSWKVKQDDEMWWVLLTSHDGVAGTAFGTEADALAVANALNLSRDLAAGGNDEPV